MDVVQVSHLCRPSIGGIENYVARLNDSLRESGHTVTTVSTTASLRADESPHPPEDDVVYCETTGSVYRNPFSVELYRRLRATDADVYHLHSPWFLPTVEAVHALPSSAPTVMTVHGVEPPSHTVLTRLLGVAYRPIAQYVLDRVTRTIVLGESERRSLRRTYSVDPEAVTVVPNGIHPAAFDVSEDRTAAFRRDHGLDPETATVLYVGRLVPVKRPHLLVRAVVRHLPDVEMDVLLVGTGEEPYTSKLRAAADDRVRFLANLPFEELKAAYAAADVFALLGSSEGLPTVVLEAMNARLPVVTTPAGALEDVVTDGEHGRLLDADPTPETVADAVRRFVERPDIRAEVGERNRRYVRTNFDWADVAADIERVYRAAIRAERPERVDAPG